MAKKSAAAVPEAATEVPTSHVGLSEAVRNAMDAVGDDGSRGRSKAIKEWIRTNIPALAHKVDAPTFSATLTIQRKARGISTGMSRNKNLLPVEPTVAEMSRVRDLAKQKGGLDALTKAVNEIVEVSQAVGGLERLHLVINCLRGLVDFSATKS
jgi:hypothetical protein